MREMILSEGVRTDGRDLTTVRPITIENGVLPRAHGSCLFTRGETQSLGTVTLGSKQAEQRIEPLNGEQYWSKYYLHYNFPPFSVGEVGRYSGTGRREIGHGKLAERAIRPILPDLEDFPYTIRLVSDILESNGSSSMATVCSCCLALMDAGAPDQEAGGRRGHGPDQGRRPGGRADRHPGRRGSPRRHGLQGHRHPRRHHRLPAGHQDRRHQPRDHDQGPDRRQERPDAHPGRDGRGHARAARPR